MPLEFGERRPTAREEMLAALIRECERIEMRKAEEARLRGAERRIPVDSFEHGCLLLERCLSDDDAEFLWSYHHLDATDYRTIRRERGAIFFRQLGRIQAEWKGTLRERLAGADAAAAVGMHLRFTAALFRLRVAGWAYRIGLPAGGGVRRATGELRRMLSNGPAAVIEIRPA